MKSRKWKVIAILLVLSVWGRTESFKVIKTWKFKLPHGSLKIYLRLFPDGTSDLGVTPADQIPAAPVQEQVQALKQVLAEMPKLGVDPKTLTYLGTRLFEQDVIQKLAYACADSSEWRSSMKRGGKGKEKLVVMLLNKSAAFEPYNEAFKPYGIVVTVTAAEKVGLMHFSVVSPRDAKDRANAKIWVPADAMIGMRFSRQN